jgi:micrococcal nuclease
MKINPWCSLAWGSCLLTSCQSSPPTYPQVQIGRVISGQSVEWIDRSTQPPTIYQGKLAGIDAPDLAQDPWGKQAKQRLAELVAAGKDGVGIEIDGDTADKYGRKSIYLWQDGRSINEQLLKEGLVLARMRAPSSTTESSGTKYRDRFLRASQYARLMGSGIWNPDAPLRMSPAEFRQEER